MTDRKGVTIKSNEKVLAAVKVILQEVNTMGGKQEVVAAIHEAVSTDHRTLQQAFWSAILLAQIEYAGNWDTNNFDMRNEQAVYLAKVVKETAIVNNFDFGLANL